MRLLQAAQDAPEGKEPWEMSQEEFLDWHNTGRIDDEAYSRYSTRQGFDWITRESYPEVYATLSIRGKQVEVRAKRESNRYVKHYRKTFRFQDQEWEGDEILRDEQGNAMYLTDEEALAKGLSVLDFGLAAFENGECVGFASNEWGSTGVWVSQDMQGGGLGTYLITELRRNIPNLKKIGQMTSAGQAMTKSYHKRLVEQALSEGKNVPTGARADYV